MASGPVPAHLHQALAHFHAEFWERIWRHHPDRSATEFYIWPREFSKTTNAERAVIALAALGFRYILYVKETQDQANDAVQNIAAILESPEVERYYPLLSQRQVNKFGHSKGWKRDRVRTASGVIMDAAGLDTSIRGLLLEGDRPDVIVLDDIDGKEDTLKTTEKKIRRITSDIIPAGAPNRVIIGLQNIINPHGVFTRLADLDPEHPADFLMDRYVSGAFAQAPLPSTDPSKLGADVGALAATLMFLVQFLKRQLERQGRPLLWWQTILFTVVLGEAISGLLFYAGYGARVGNTALPGAWILFGLVASGIAMGLKDVLTTLAERNKSEVVVVPPTTPELPLPGVDGVVAVPEGSRPLVGRHGLVDGLPVQDAPDATGLFRRLN